jgi:hypothetical protein
MQPSRTLTGPTKPQPHQGGFQKTQRINAGATLLRPKANQVKQIFSLF